MSSDPKSQGILFREYISALFHYSPLRAILYLAIMIATELTQSIGLLMIIPILALTGISGMANPTSGIVHYVYVFYQHTGLELSLPNVLMIYVAIVSLAALLKRQQAVMMNAHFREGFVAYIRNRVYANMTHASWEFYTSKRNADITALLTTEINSVGNSIHFFLTIISTILLIIVNLIISFMLSVPMSAFALSTALILFFVLIPWHKKVSRTGEAARVWRQNMFSNILEHLGGMKLSKSSCKEECHIEQFAQMSNGLLTEAVRFSRINANSHMIHTICAVLALSMLCYMAIAVIHIETGLLLVLIYIFSQTIPRFSILQRNIHYFVHSLPSFHAIICFEKECIANKEHLDSSSQKSIELTHAITFENVSFQYRQSVSPVLSHLNMTFLANQTTAVVGPSGAGKSTLADLLMGLLKPQQGRILLDETPLDDACILDWRNHISYVPQDNYLLNDTIRANLQWACPECNETDMREALQAARAMDFVNALPSKLETLIGDRGVRLSGGERQRLALARALLRKPTLLLLDEAMNALDTENEQQIRTAINKLHGKMTIIIITHRKESTQDVDHVVVLNNS